VAIEKSGRKKEQAGGLAGKALIIYEQAGGLSGRCRVIAERWIELVLV
jgi:hypothetical protein